MKSLFLQNECLNSVLAFLGPNTLRNAREAAMLASMRRGAAKEAEGAARFISRSVLPIREGGVHGQERAPGGYRPRGRHGAC